MLNIFSILKCKTNIKEKLNSRNSDFPLNFNWHFACLKVKQYTVQCQIYGTIHDKYFIMSYGGFNM
jgi:hypothetical protein